MHRNGSTMFWGVFVLVPAIALGSLGLTACGGGAERAGEGDAATQGAEKETEQERIQAEQELQARRDRLARATGEASDIRSAASSELPMADEKLEAILADLEDAASQVDTNLTGGQAEVQLSRIDQLLRQANNRLDTLKKQEQEARQALHEQYDREVEQGKELPPDLVRGLDGEEYLGYLPSAVEKAQQSLREQGYYGGPVNGRLDEATRVAIARFQQLNGLHVTGIPTPFTRARLYG